MDRDQLRAAVADAVGNPESGPVAEAIDRIVDAVLGEQQPTKREKRVVEPAETPGE
jgi:hypothetical protein